MSQATKIEVMDFLINVLRDHEQSLDTLITRAEGVIENKQSPQNMSGNPPPMKITLRDWEEFKNRAIEAEMVCYDIVDSMFTCKAITETKVYIYRERTPEIELDVTDDYHVQSGLNRADIENGAPFLNGKLKIGLELVAKKMRRSNDLGNPMHIMLHELDALYIKNWLSREIGIHRDIIVQGSVG